MLTTQHRRGSATAFDDTCPAFVLKYCCYYRRLCALFAGPSDNTFEPRRLWASAISSVPCLDGFRNDRRALLRSPVAPRPSVHGFNDPLVAGVPDRSPGITSPPGREPADQGCHPVDKVDETAPPYCWLPAICRVSSPSGCVYDRLIPPIVCGCMKLPLRLGLLRVLSRGSVGGRTTVCCCCHGPPTLPDDITLERPDLLGEDGEDGSILSFLFMQTSRHSLNRRARGDAGFDDLIVPATNIF